MGMTLALSKPSDKVHRARVPSPVFTGHMDSEGALLGIDIEPPRKLLEDSYAHRWESIGYHSLETFISYFY